MEMRIYLTGLGKGGYRPLINGIKSLISEGILPNRKDRNNKQFLFLSDLLHVKGKYVGTNIHNKMSISFSNLLTEGIIAFGEISNICRKILADANAPVKYNYRPYLEKGYLGYVIIHNPLLRNWVGSNYPELSAWLN